MYENICFPSIILFSVTKADVKYTIQERVFLLWHYYELNHVIKLLLKEFEREYPNRSFLTCHTIYNMDQKFECTGPVGDALCSGHPRDARTKENVYVAQAVVEKPTRSTRHSALQLGLSRLVLLNKNLVMQKK